MKYCTLLGQKFGIATLYEYRWVSHYRQLIKTYGLDGFCIDKDPVRSVDITTDEVINKGMKDPQLIVDAVRKTAEELANDGAEVVQIGCGLFDSICYMAGLNSVMDGKVPLTAPLLVSLKVAETMVTFEKEFGTPFRSGLSCYEKIPKEDLNSIREKYNLPMVE